MSLREETEITRSLMRARCERGAEIARLLGLGPGTAAAIRALDEHWDGHGQPEGLRGEEIPLGARILCLAQTVEIFHAARGLRRGAAGRLAAQRRLVRPAAGRRAAAHARRHGVLALAARPASWRRGSRASGG